LFAFFITKFIVNFFAAIAIAACRDEPLRKRVVIFYTQVGNFSPLKV